jgi:photosystem II stability/assembly factor-like uncharacterized protein
MKKNHSHKHATAAIFLIWAAGVAGAQSWVPQESGTTASLRGVSAVDSNIVWASGTKGTYLRTTDGGATWHAATIPGAADLDFRAIRGFDGSSAVAMSAGNGEASRIYKLAKDQWRLVFTNPDPKGFFDCMGFWDDEHGILLGDPVNGKFVIFTTDNGGESWRRQKGPGAESGEGAYAASNTCLIVRGTREAWFGTGAGRVFHSTDGGETWSGAKTRMAKGASAGIFSLAFADGRHGIAVGGDYNKPADTAGNIAMTGDGGKSWTEPAAGPAGYRSAVAYIAGLKMWIAVGTSGSDASTDDGQTWKKFDAGNYNAVSFAGDAGWAVGPKGAIARFSPK